MPCQSYEPEYDRSYEMRQDKDLRDKLARIACKAMTRLEGMGIMCADDKEMYDWFQQHKIDDAKAAKSKLEADKAEAERKRRQREARRAAELTTLKKLQSKYGRDV